MIVVTGATGQLGRAIAVHLAKRVPLHRVGASVRDPAKAADLRRWASGSVAATSTTRPASGTRSRVLPRC